MRMTIRRVKLETKRTITAERRDVGMLTCMNGLSCYFTLIGRYKFSLIMLTTSFTHLDTLTTYVILAVKEF